MTSPVAAPTFSEVESMLVWERVDWDYFANGPEGDRWHIFQSASKEWSVFRNGSLDVTTVTFRDAKFWVTDTTFEELRPDIHEAREARREERHARRRAGARS